nr:reverse transcriptase domain-containing protein [Tanacetum cinerariifolium]
MTGVLRHIAKHRLNVREGCLPIRQKKRGQAPKRNKAIYKEVEKLVNADIMNEVHYHSWLPNPVMEESMAADGESKKSLPFFKTLKKKKKSDFQWIAEAKTAFKQMKKSIAKLPMLTAPTKKEELIIYLAAAKETISAVLMTEKDEKQVPIYFVSRALQDGSSCTDGSGANLILTNPEGMEFIYALRFRFDVTNNEAKYEALIAGLRIAEQMGVKNLQANVDSRIMANKVNETYISKESCMIKYLGKKKFSQNKKGRQEPYAARQALEINLDLLEDKREQAAIQEAKSKAKMEKYYNARVYNTSFNPRDLVYRNNKEIHAEDGGKLETKWEGPYEVTKALGNGAYKLRDRNGNICREHGTSTTLRNVMCMKWNTHSSTQKKRLFQFLRESKGLV